MTNNNETRPSSLMYNNKIFDIIFNDSQVSFYWTANIAHLTNCVFYRNHF